MWIRIKQAFAPPVFEDEEKTRRASVLNAIVWIILFVAVVRSVTPLFTPSGDVRTSLAFGGFVVAVSVGTFWLIRTGRVRIASFAFISLLWIMMTVAALRYGGVRGTNFDTYTVIIILTGWLWGGREAIGCTVASIVAGLALFLLEQNGLISPDLDGLALDATFAATAVRFVAVGTLVYLYHSDFSKAIARARSNEHTLAERAKEVAVFRALAENAADAILMSSLDGKITFANQASYTMFGYDYGRQEMVGLDIATLISPLERRNADQETLSAALGAGSWRGELQQRRKDDSTFHASSTFFAIRDESRRTVALASIIRDVTAQKRAEAAQQELQQEIIETQRQTLQELSTPVIPVMDRILVMPMVGNIDSARAKDVTRALLAGISEHRAKFVILDVTGVPIMDSGVVNHLNKTIHAARLKGAYTIVTGIADAVAETIVDLGIDWGAIDARRNLQTGLVTALNKLGFDVIDRQERNITRYGGGR